MISNGIFIIRCFFPKLITAWSNTSKFLKYFEWNAVFLDVKTRQGAARRPLLESVHFLAPLFVNLRQKTQQSINDLYNSENSFCCQCWQWLIVSDPPQVSLHLGSTLNADDIKEGDDVYFECRVMANPHWRKLTWLHNVSSLQLFYKL